MTRNQCASRLRRLAGLAGWEANFGQELRRGRCAKRGCKSRYAVVRITYDLRDRREVLTSATLECAECGRTWRRTRVPDLREWKNVQRHALTLILPPEKRVKIWVTRGHIKREGDDALIVENANYGLLMDAMAEWRKRNGTYEAAKARAKARKAEAKAITEAETVAWIKRMTAEWDARDAAAKELGIA